MSIHFKYVIYKITFPNGKIYIGKDIAKNGHSIRYFGSWDNIIVEQDFSKKELIDFTLRKEIIFESDDISFVNKMEIQTILKLQANNPKKGYNKLPVFLND